MKIEPQPTLPVFDGMVYRHTIEHFYGKGDRLVVRGYGVLMRGVAHPSLSGLVCRGALREFDLTVKKPERFFNLTTGQLVDERDLFNVTRGRLVSSDV